MGKWSFADEHAIISKHLNDEYKKNLIKNMREKHQPLDQHQGAIGAVTYCVGCKTPGGLLNTLWPCDVVTLINVTGS